MSGFNLAVALVAAAAFAISKFFGKKGDDPPPHPPPPRDSYYSYNSGTWNQTQQSYRPPQQPYRPSQQSYRPSPPPSYHHRSLATKAPSQTTTRTPTSPDYGYDDYHPSASYIRAPIQTQPSTRSQTTARTSAPPDYDYDDYGLSAAHVRAPCQTRPPTRSQTTTRGSAPPDYGYDDYDLSAAHVRALSQRQPSTRTRSSRAYSSLFDSGNVHEPLESGWSPLSSHTPSHVYTGSELPPPTVIQVISPDRRPDEPASVEDLDFAKKLREQARRRGREMSEARSRAKSAQKKGYRGAANAHRQEAIAYESAMKKLDKRAAKIIFRENNKVSS